MSDIRDGSQHTGGKLGMPGCQSQSRVQHVCRGCGGDDFNGFVGQISPCAWAHGVKGQHATLGIMLVQGVQVAPTKAGRWRHMLQEGTGGSPGVQEMLGSGQAELGQQEVSFVREQGGIRPLRLSQQGLHMLLGPQAWHQVLQHALTSSMGAGPCVWQHTHGVELNSSGYSCHDGYRGAWSCQVLLGGVQTPVLHISITEHHFQGQGVVIRSAEVQHSMKHTLDTMHCESFADHPTIQLFCLLYIALLGRAQKQGLPGQLLWRSLYWGQVCSRTSQVDAVGAQPRALGYLLEGFG
mmetsp:Transcript_1348/g.2928  ORF Transcript_1348/g.2928 Transcript_1348/m.2928 type:complete len:295 (-) Transcript_1348:1136-2020(-)